MMLSKGFKFVLMLGVLSLSLNAWSQSEQGSQPSGGSAEQKDESMGEALLHPKVRMKTSMGGIVLQLNAEKAPITVLNFLQYAKDGFYDGTIFHRVISEFMIQGGGFTKDMEKKEEGLREPIKNEWENGLTNDRYTIAMARLPRQPDSATAQFFINVADNEMLDQPRDGAGYAVFGKVVEGKEVVDKIKNTEVIDHPQYPGNQAVTPKEPVVIQSVELIGDFDEAAAQKMAQKEREREAKLEEKKEEQIAEAISNLVEDADVELQEGRAGLRYGILNEGTGESPEPTDQVKVHYKGVYITGEQFDSSYDRGEPATFPLNQVIPGWTLGVSQMKVGGKRILVVPPHLGYGNQPPQGMPANATLIFLVELLEIPSQQ